jgi:hypothetical protein
LLKPVTVIGEEEEFAEILPGVELAVYVREVFGLPVYSGAVKLLIQL